MPHPLDNAVWHSLTGPRSIHGLVKGRAGRFEPDVSVFCAVDDEASPSAYDDLRDVVGAGGTAVLFRPVIAPPEGWTNRGSFPGVQLVATDVVDPPDDDRFVPLGADDVEDMVALVDETRPGPFGPRTFELGGYLGLRDADGRLVAMAGERLRVEGFTEISAVCTAPTHQRQGLGAALVLALIRRIRDRGEEAFLHAAATNESAIRLYLALGFTHRTDVDAAQLKAPA